LGGTLSVHEKVVEDLSILQIPKLTGVRSSRDSRGHHRGYSSSRARSLTSSSIGVRITTSTASSNYRDGNSTCTYYWCRYGGYRARGDKNIT
jgi:hypothetical protein